MKPKGRAGNGTLSRLRAWAEAEPAVRAAVLIGSRAEPSRELDALSDYDIALFLADGHGLAARDDWLAEFGEVLIWLPETVEHMGRTVPTRLVQYRDGTRIDFTLSRVEVLEAIHADGRLPPWLDSGFVVLVDKDGAARDLPVPRGIGYVPERPDEARYREVVREFWWEAICVARSLARGELLPARYSAECVLRFRCIVPMIEWHIQEAGDWQVPVRAVGRGLLDVLPGDDRHELERTFAGSSPSENWEALFAAMSFFRRISRSVARDLEFDYPEVMDGETTGLVSALRRSTAETRDRQRGSR